MSQKIEINIEELVLHGFAPGDRSQIGEALEIALMQAFAQKGATSALTKSEDISFADAGSFPLQPNSKFLQIGTAIAGSIHSTVAGGNKREI